MAIDKLLPKRETCGALSLWVLFPTQLYALLWGLLCLHPKVALLRNEICVLCWSIKDNGQNAISKKVNGTSLSPCTDLHAN